MTLCIAAACQDRGRERVVIGTDWRVTGEISAGADIQDKLYWINDDMAMLVSGSVTRAVELRDTYRVVLERMKAREKPEEIDRLNIRRFIKTGAKLFKKELADEVATFATGLSYKDMREAVAKKEIPKAVSVPVFQHIEKQDFECDVIIVAFIGDLEFIFQIEKSGHIEECDNFAIVGEGAYVAQAFMYLRKHDSEDRVDLTLYHVYEAMEMASRCVGSVGKEHSIDVLYPPNEDKREPGVTGDELTSSGFGFMRRRFKDYGIRTISRFPRLPKGALKPESFV